MTSSKHKLTKCEQSVYKTLTYFSFFNYPVSLYRLSNFLIAKEPYSFSQIQEALKSLHHMKLISDFKDLYSIRGSKKVDVDLRKMLSKQAIAQVQELLPILIKIPWIKLICVTGSCAAFNKDPEGDIDLFIVTAKNRLWISRLFLVLILKILKAYRTEKVYANKVCPNLLVSEDAMSWDHDKNVYVAHEICAMHPLFEKDNCYFKFISQNVWVRSFFPHFFCNYQVEETQKCKASTLDSCERLFMRLQIWYMTRRLTTEVVSSSYIHFNRTNTKNLILHKFQNG